MDGDLEQMETGKLVEREVLNFGVCSKISIQIYMVQSRWYQIVDR